MEPGPEGPGVGTSLSMLGCDVDEGSSSLQRGRRNRCTLGHKSNEIPDCILGAAIDSGCKDDQKVNIWSLIKHGPSL